jgi:hypothetical protein
MVAVAARELMKRQRARDRGDYETGEYSSLTVNFPSK